MNTNTGGQAFPCLDDSGSGTGLQLREAGMTLRDYFAAHAMHAAVAKAIHNLKCDGARNLTVDWDHIAESCYDAADAMLKAREA